MSGWQTVIVIAVLTLTFAVLGIRALLRGRRVPAKAKLALAAGIAWLLSPIDLLPDVALPVGLLDDIAVLAAAVRYFLDQAQPASAAPPVHDRVRDRRAIDAADWRLSDDPPR